MLFDEGDDDADSYSSDDINGDGDDDDNDDVDSNMAGMAGELGEISLLNIVEATEVSPAAEEVNIVTQESVVGPSTVEGVQQELNGGRFTLDPHTRNILAVQLMQMNPIGARYNMDATLPNTEVQRHFWVT